MSEKLAAIFLSKNSWNVWDELRDREDYDVCFPPQKKEYEDIMVDWGFFFQKKEVCLGMLQDKKDIKSFRLEINETF